MQKYKVSRHAYKWKMRLHSRSCKRPHVSPIPQRLGSHKRKKGTSACHMHHLSAPRLPKLCPQGSWHSRLQISLQRMPPDVCVCYGLVAHVYIHIRTYIRMQMYTYTGTPISIYTHTLTCIYMLIFAYRRHAAGSCAVALR